MSRFGVIRELALRDGRTLPVSRCGMPRSAMSTIVSGSRPASSSRAQRWTRSGVAPTNVACRSMTS